MMRRANKPVSAKGSRLDAFRVQAIDARARGDQRRAIELAGHYLARRPDDLGVLDFLANVHLERKDWAAFLPVGMKSYLKTPRAKHLVTLLNAYLQLGRYDAALAFYERERTRQPDNVLDESPVCTWKIHSHVRKIKRLRRQEEKAHAREAKAAKRAAREQAAIDVQTAAATDAETPSARPVALKIPRWPGGPPAAVRRRVRFDESAIEAELLSLCETDAGIPVQFIDAPGPKRGGLAECLANEFQTVNIRCELTGVSEMTAEYLEIGWFVAVEKPEPGEAALDVWINRGTSALVAFPHGSLSTARAPRESECAALAPLDSADARLLIGGAAANVSAPLDGCIAEFVRRAQAGLDHDLAVRDDELRSQWERFIDGLDSGDSVRQTEVDERLRQLVSQRRRAATELAHQHEVAVSLQPVSLRRLLMPVTAVSVRITRRTKSRPVAMTWNPIIRRFEPVACGQCGTNTYLLAANHLAELRCVDCLAGRSSQGKKREEKVSG